MTGAVTDDQVRAYLGALRDRGVDPIVIEAMNDETQTLILIESLGYVLIAVSRETPGYWQLDRDTVDAVSQRARNEEQAVFYALLIERRDGRGANGYILSDFSSSPLKRPLEIEGDQVIIQEKRHLDSLRLILSTEKQVELLLRKRS
jgi:hypothetical protein